MRGRSRSTVDLVGESFHRLTVTALGRPGQVIVQCVCGSPPFDAPVKSLRNGNTKSCGCLGREMLAAGLRLRHGMSKSLAHKRWMKMRSRVNTPHYIERGIRLHPRWESFEAFYLDMGDPPGPEYTLDRMDNNRGYEPGNCQWATMKQQGNNRSSNVVVEAHGRRLTLTQWAEETGVNPGTISRRLRDGLSGEDAVRKGYVRRSAP